MSDVIRNENEKENRSLSPMLEIKNYTKVYGEGKKAASLRFPKEE